VGKYWGGMSRGKPVLVSVMFSRKARKRWGSVHSMAPRPREETSSSRRSQTLARVGPVRIACWNVSGSVSQRGEVGSGFSLNLEGWAAR